MTNCRRIEKDLIAYLDAKAGVLERREVETHLADCAACRARAEEFHALWGVLDELPTGAPSPSFDAAVQARIAAEPLAQSWWRWLMPSPRLALAASVLVALSVWMLTIRQQAPPPVVTVAQQHVSESDFGAIMQLQTLENYDVLANFDALSDLPAGSPVAPRR